MGYAAKQNLQPCVRWTRQAGTQQRRFAWTGSFLDNTPDEGIN